MITIENVEKEETLTAELDVTEPEITITISGAKHIESMMIYFKSDKEEEETGDEV